MNLDELHGEALSSVYLVECEGWAQSVTVSSGILSPDRSDSQPPPFHSDIGLAMRELMAAKLDDWFIEDKGVAICPDAQQEDWYGFPHDGTESGICEAILRCLIAAKREGV